MIVMGLLTGHRRHVTRDVLIAIEPSKLDDKVLKFLKQFNLVLLYFCYDMLY